MSSFGVLYRFSTYGESHGISVGAIIEGVPSGIGLSNEDIQIRLDRRRPGQPAIGGTTRNEADQVTIESGTYEGNTIGTPILMRVLNKAQRPIDYANLNGEKAVIVPRPGHGDLTYLLKYDGFAAKSGGGRASARETIGRVCAGALAAKILKEISQTYATSWVLQVGSQSIPSEINNAFITERIPYTYIDTLGILEVDDTRDLFIDLYGNEYSRSTGELIKNCDTDLLLRSNEYSSISIPSKEFTFHGTGSAAPVFEPILNADKHYIVTRCPHPPTAAKISALIQKVQSSGDSVGGYMQACIHYVPPGLGEPVFEKFSAVLAQAMMSIPAVKGFDIGSGFNGTDMRGSSHNDLYEYTDNSEYPEPVTNHAGGVYAGITSGTSIIFRLAIKPVSSINKSQETVNLDGAKVSLEVHGRHDSCVLSRACEIIDSMSCVVTLDALLRQKSRTNKGILNPISLKKGSFPFYKYL